MSMIKSMKEQTPPSARFRTGGGRAQGAFTEPLRTLVQMPITEDGAYVARLQRHYEMIKAAQQGPDR